MRPPAGRTFAALAMQRQEEDDAFDMASDSSTRARGVAVAARQAWPHGARGVLRPLALELMMPAPAQHRGHRCTLSCRDRPSKATVPVTGAQNLTEIQL
ncbi:hypothetical protein ABZP36_030512 [Zizania latifolia]